jgi:hypothetical protein
MRSRYGRKYAPSRAFNTIVRFPVLRRVGGRLGVGLHGVAVGVIILSNLLPNTYVQLFAPNKDREFSLGDEACLRRRCPLPAAGLRNAPRFSACNVSTSGGVTEHFDFCIF